MTVRQPSAVYPAPRRAWNGWQLLQLAATISLPFPSGNSWPWAGSAPHSRTVAATDRSASRFMAAPFEDDDGRNRREDSSDERTGAQTICPSPRSAGRAIMPGTRTTLGGRYGQEDPVRRCRSHWKLHRCIPLARRPRRDARRSVDRAGRDDPQERHLGDRASRSLGLVMSKIGVALWKPGQVERGAEKGQGTGHDVFRVGEHDGRITARATEVAEMLKVIDGALVTDNLWGERWTKLCANSTGNPVQAMSGLGSSEIASSEVGRAITIHLGAESARVGLALGYRVPKFNGSAAEQWAAADRRDVYESLDRLLTPTSAGGRNWRSSMGQDVTKGRPTEIDYMNGHVVRQGREAGVPTPR